LDATRFSSAHFAALIVPDVAQKRTPDERLRPRQTQAANFPCRQFSAAQTRNVIFRMDKRNVGDARRRRRNYFVRPQCSLCKQFVADKFKFLYRKNVSIADVA
jgi:hypothetical protein